MRQPPKFATDPWCWDYTREKVNSNHQRKHGTTLSYEDWEPKHFMAANRIYKAVVNKYGEGRSVQGIECPRCEQVNEFPEGDYICVECRFGTPEAEEVAVEPEVTMEDFEKEFGPVEVPDAFSEGAAASAFEKLVAANGAGNVLPAPAPAAAVTAAQKASVATANSPARSDSGRIRNIGAMSDDKLIGLAYEMRGYSDPEAHAKIVSELCARGITV